MSKEDLRKLIIEIIKEVEDEEPYDPENDHKEPENWEIDPDVGGKSFEDDEIWPGSDIAGGKKGGTMFPHGQGYPNSPYRKGRKLTKKDLEKILHIDQVDATEKQQEKFGKECQKYTYDFIKKNMPWVFTYGHKGEYEDKMHYPFAPYFSNDYQSHEVWLDGFYSTVDSQRGHFVHWLNFPKEQLKGAAKYNKHWILRYKWAKQIHQQYPTFEQDLKKLMNFLGELYKSSPITASNPKNYPLYVSLYDTTKRLGGHEEGGWWYDEDDLIQSYKVNNYKDARKAAVHFLRTMGQADLNGKPLIVLEKEKGSKSGKEPPTYS